MSVWILVSMVIISLGMTLMTLFYMAKNRYASFVIVLTCTCLLWIITVKILVGLI